MEEKELSALKTKFDIVGNDPGLNRALEISLAVAPTDLTVLVSGESGVGKENIPRIIHQNSRRKNGRYFAVNCGAIPEGTVDSELFGHEKGSFTGAVEMRRGYFEEADGGTLFLDEIGELPLATQARLLRVLQSGEFIRVGSSKVLKSDVRVIAATNVNLQHAVATGKFREDLYYRLAAVCINVPALRERREDIHLLFRKFTSDFAYKYSMSNIRLTEDAVVLLKNYRWPGNIRQLKNVAEAVSALESVKMAPGTERQEVDSVTLARYLPKEEGNQLPVLSSRQSESGMSQDEREILFRAIYTLRQEMDNLRKDVESLKGNGHAAIAALAEHTEDKDNAWAFASNEANAGMEPEEQEQLDPAPVPEQTLSIRTSNDGLIRQALEKCHGNRKEAAALLGISERTLYRKIKSMEEQ